jgi:hypothetical protein
MTGTLSVKNWDEFQHYKDRNPPWIKLHNSLLEDYEFECLQDASKGHLLCIWMLASRTNNKIPYDAAWIGRKIGASDTIDLDALIGSGFLVLNQQDENVGQDASKALADDKQSAIPEKRRGEGEKRQNQRKSFTPPDQSEVCDYMAEKGLSSEIAKIEAEKFFNFYDSKGWVVGKTKMTKWKSCVSGWIGRMDKPQASSGDFGGYVR